MWQRLTNKSIKIDPAVGRKMYFGFFLLITAIAHSTTSRYIIFYSYYICCILICTYYPYCLSTSLVNWNGLHFDYIFCLAFSRYRKVDSQLYSRDKLVQRF